MSKRRKWLIVLACLALAVMLALVLTRNREPRYEGRTLSEWTIRLSKSSSDPEAKSAIKTIGTNALPSLFEWIQYEPPLGKNRSIGFINWIRLRRPGVYTMTVDERKHRATGAMLAIRTLGPEAESLIGDLGRIASGPKAASVDDDERLVAVRATLALPWLGDAALSHLVSALTNKQNLVPHVAAEAIGELGTNALPAIPALIQSLNHTNDRVVWRAMESLGKLRLQQSLVVPALAGELKNPDPFLRSCAAEALGQFEREAKPAIHALIAVMGDSDQDVRRNATNALVKIAPEVVTNAPPE